MQRWTPEEVLAASRALNEAWLPSGVEIVRSKDFVVVCRPERVVSRGSSRVEVSVRSSRPLCELRPEVEHVARNLGAGEVRWRIDAATAALGEPLRRAGATLELTELVLARPLGESQPDLLAGTTTSPDVAVNLVSDKATFDALMDVETAGWEWPPRSADGHSEEWARVRGDLRACTRFALVGTVNGQPASVARFAVQDSVARLYGAVTLPAFRGRGLYRSLVTARCHLAQEHGATLALTKGRLDTSAPILERIGFVRYAVEQCWRLSVEAS